jgi:hypothetical protein
LHEAIDHSRRLCGAAAFTFTAVELGVIGAASAKTTPPTQPAAIKKGGARRSLMTIVGDALAALIATSVVARFEVVVVHSPSKALVSALTVLDVACRRVVARLG